MQGIEVTYKKLLLLIISALCIILIIFALVSVCRFALVFVKFITRLYQNMKKNEGIEEADKRTLIMIIAMLFITLIIAALLWSNHVKVQKAQEQESARQIPILLSYIEGHNGEVFDYDFVSENLGIPRKQIFALLKQLRNERKIGNQQQYIRHPILLSDNDHTNFFWRVYIIADEQPRSELEN